MSRYNKYIRQKTENKIRLLKLKEYTDLLHKTKSSSDNTSHKQNNIRFLEKKIQNVSQYVF